MLLPISSNSLFISPHNHSPGSNSSASRPPNEPSQPLFPQISGPSIPEQKQESFDLEKALKSEKESMLIYHLLQKHFNIEDDSKDAESHISEDTIYSIEIAQNPDWQAFYSSSFSENSSASMFRFDAVQSQMLNVEFSNEGLSLTFNMELSVELQLGQTPNQQGASDPLVIDTLNNGFQLSSDSVLFDINADGQKELTEIPGEDDYFLAIDWNNNGLIDSGKELFGDQWGAINGFEELAQYDSNNDKQIDKDDAIFKQLLLMQFRSGQQHLVNIQNTPVQSISLDYKNTQQWLSERSQLIATAQVQLNDGTETSVGDEILAYGTVSND